MRTPLMIMDTTVITVKNCVSKINWFLRTFLFLIFTSQENIEASIIIALKSIVFFFFCTSQETIEESIIIAMKSIVFFLCSHKKKNFFVHTNRSWSIKLPVSLFFFLDTYESRKRRNGSHSFHGNCDFFWELERTWNYNYCENRLKWYPYRASSITNIHISIGLKMCDI